MRVTYADDEDPQRRVSIFHVPQIPSHQMVLTTLLHTHTCRYTQWDENRLRSQGLKEVGEIYKLFLELEHNQTWFNLKCFSWMFFFPDWATHFAKPMRKDIYKMFVFNR